MTIRPVSKNGRPAFLLDAGTIGGRRRRFFFQTKREAERKREQLLQDRRAVGAAWADVAPRDRARVVAVLGEMEAKGLKKCGVYAPERAAERRDRRAAAGIRRRMDAKFPLSLCALSVKCRVEVTHIPEPHEQVEARRQSVLAAARARSRSAYLSDPAKHRARAREWLKSNPEKVRAYAKKYRTKAKAVNPERFRAYRRKSRKMPYNRIRQNLRARLRQIVKRKGGSVTSALTGCNASTLKLHLQSQFKRGMAWNNYGAAWVVDHIVPCAKFDLSIKSQQQACFHFSNLRPLFAQENADKSDSIVPCQPELVLVL